MAIAAQQPYRGTKNNGKTSLRRKLEAPLLVPTDLRAKATRDISGAINSILADVFALYFKTKNFHWPMSGPHFRDELREDNETLVKRLREAHGICDEHEDIATASLIENWVDETERRHWFLFETCRSGAPRH